MRLDESKILVIGGGGFIGSQVVAELLKTKVAEVRVYDNFARGKIENIESELEDRRCNIWPHGGDIRDIDLLNDAMEGMDGVIHLAAMWLLHCRDYPRTAFHVNIEGTFNVLEACVKNNIKRLVYSSSASVYGDAAEVPMTENHPFNNRNFYGATKIAGEAMCRAYHDRYGLDYVGLRYMNVYGPRQDQHAVYSGVIPIMLNNIDAEKAPTVNGDGTQAYDFIYSEDVAKKMGYKVKVGRFSLNRSGKAIALGDAEGLIKTVIDEDNGALLGAHMFGPEVTELIHGYALARNAEITEAEILETVFPHPTLSEAMHEAVLDAYGRAIHF